MPELDFVNALAFTKSSSFVMPELEYLKALAFRYSSSGIHLVTIAFFVILCYWIPPLRFGKLRATGKLPIVSKLSLVCHCFPAFFQQTSGMRYPIQASLMVYHPTLVFHWQTSGIGCQGYINK